MYTLRQFRASLAEHAKSFLLKRLRTFVVGQNINSPVFNRLRTLEGKTPGGGIMLLAP
jgi:hypothetical protein